MIEFNPDLLILLLGMTCAFDGGSHLKEGNFPFLFEQGTSDSVRDLRLGDVGEAAETRCKYIHVSSSPTSLLAKVSAASPTPPNLAGLLPLSMFAILSICCVHSWLSNAIMSGSNMNNSQFG
jgi:hypothetical protein